MLCIELREQNSTWGIDRKKIKSFTYQNIWCIGYKDVLDRKRTKLEDKSSKLIFTGYETKSKAYKLFNPNNLKIFISRDVGFNKEGV